MYFHDLSSELAYEKKNKILETYNIYYLLFAEALDSKGEREDMLILHVVSCSGSRTGE